MAGLAFTNAARATDIPPRPDPVMMQQIGTTLTSAERDQAWQFCLDMLAQSPLLKAEPVRACACFPARWEALTNRLERLALPIMHAPHSPEAHQALALIGQTQGGFHDNALQSLSVDYRAAAKAAMRACL